MIKEVNRIHSFLDKANIASGLVGNLTDTIIALAEDSGSVLRSESIFMIGAFPIKAGEYLLMRYATEVAETYRDQLNVLDRDYEFVGNLMYSLGKFDTDDSHPCLVSLCSREFPSAIRKYAIYYIAEHCSHFELELFKEVIASEEEEDVTVGAILGLSLALSWGFSNKNLVSIVAGKLSSPTPAVRIAAIRSLAYTLDPKCIELLRPLTVDRERSERDGTDVASVAMEQVKLLEDIETASVVFRK